MTEPFGSSFGPKGTGQLTTLSLLRRGTVSMSQFLPLTTTRKREQGPAHPGASPASGGSFPGPLQRSKGPEGVGSQSMTHMFQRWALGWLRAGSFAGLPFVLRHIPKVTQVTVYEMSGRWAEKAEDEQRQSRKRAGFGVRRPPIPTPLVTLMTSDFIALRLNLLICKPALSLSQGYGEDRMR